MTWAYEHKGGLPLIDASVEYQQGDAGETIEGAMMLEDETTVLIPSLVAGYTYLVTVTAENDEGAVSSQCPRLPLTIGNDGTQGKNIYNYIYVGGSMHVPHGC